MPSISVLMPVRDAGPYLAASVASLRRQSFRDFEIVAVDDGSTDGSGEALERAARRERRLRVVRQPARGLPEALNTALAAAQSEWIARHDADDLSHPQRLALQRAWLADHPQTDVVGCRVRLLPRGFAGAGMRRWVAWHNRLLDHDAMAREALVDSPLAHGTAMMRRDALAALGGWRELGWPEDLDLWLRAIAAGLRLGKVPRALYAWRQHAASATRRDPRYRQQAFDALRVDALRRGLLRRAAELALIGVGRSVERWQANFGAAGYPARLHLLRRPAPDALARLTRPAVLVYGAPLARRRWRTALRSCGWCEGRDFVFVA